MKFLRFSLAAVAVAFFAAHTAALPLHHSDARAQQRFLRAESATKPKVVDEGCAAALKDIYTKKLYKANGSKRQAVATYMAAKWTQEQSTCLDLISDYEKWDLFRTKKARMKQAKDIADKCVKLGGVHELNFPGELRDSCYAKITDEASHDTATNSRKIFDEVKAYAISEIVDGISYSLVNNQAKAECKAMLIALGCGNPAKFGF